MKEEVEEVEESFLPLKRQGDAEHCTNFPSLFVSAERLFCFAHLLQSSFITFSRSERSGGDEGEKGENPYVNKKKKARLLLVLCCLASSSR